MDKQADKEFNIKKNKLYQELKTKEIELYKKLECNNNIIKRIYRLQDRISKTIESYPKFLDDFINKNFMIKHQETGFYYFDIAKLIKENNTEDYKELKAAAISLSYYRNNNLHVFLLKKSELYNKFVSKICKGELYEILRKINKIKETIANIENYINQYDFIEKHYKENTIEHNTICEHFLECNLTLKRI